MGFVHLELELENSFFWTQGVLESSHRSECNYRHWSQTPLEFKPVQVWITTQYYLIVWEKLFSKCMFLWVFLYFRVNMGALFSILSVPLQLNFPRDWGSVCISWIKLENSKFFKKLRKEVLPISQNLTVAWLQNIPVCLIKQKDDFFWHFMFKWRH